MNSQMKALLIVLVVLAVAAGGCGKSNSTTSSTAAPGASSGGAGGGSGAFTQFREEHKFTFQLSRLAHNIGRLGADKKTSLTAAQAKSVLGVLNPLRKQESLDQDQAKTAIKQLQDILTEGQRAAISTMPPEHQFRRSGPPPGGAQGSRPPMDMKAMESFNPFNPPKDSPMAKRGSARMAQLFKDLEKAAKGK